MRVGVQGRCGSRAIARPPPTAWRSARASPARRTPTSTRRSSPRGTRVPTPSFGAPALVWHVADLAAPAQPMGLVASPSRATRTIPQARSMSRPSASSSAAARVVRPDQRLSGAAAEPLPAQGRPAKAVQCWSPRTISSGGRRATTGMASSGPSQILEQEIVPFTLWWGEPGEHGAGHRRHPGVRASGGERRLRLHQLLHGHRPALELAACCRARPRAGRAAAPADERRRRHPAHLRDAARAGGARAARPPSTCPRCPRSCAAPTAARTRTCTRRSRRTATCSTSTSGRRSRPRWAAGSRTLRAPAARCSPTSAASSCRPAACRTAAPRLRARGGGDGLASARCRSPTSAPMRKLQRRRRRAQRRRQGVLAVRAPHHAARRLPRVHRLRRVRLARHLHHRARLPAASTCGARSASPRGLDGG